MTIKNQDKIVSEENQDVVTDATLSNGILTLIRRNLYSGIVDHENDIEIDLSDHKLKLKIVTQERLTALESSTSQSDINERESYIFLVSLGESSSEGYYREYIWVEGNNGGEFEAIGSTKIDLTNYIQKSNTNGLIKNDGTIDTNTYLTAQDISGKANTADLGETAFSNDYNDLDNIPTQFTPAAHNQTSSTITDMEAVAITITYTDNKTETLTLFKQVNNS